MTPQPAVTRDQNRKDVIAEGVAVTAASGAQERVTVDLDLRTAKASASPSQLRMIKINPYATAPTKYEKRQAPRTERRVRFSI